MIHERYSRNLRQAAADADWQRTERLGRAYGWRLLGATLCRAIRAAAARFSSPRRVAPVARDAARQGDAP